MEREEFEEKMAKKIRRKQKRCEMILEKNENIKCVSHPTKFIFIGNYGLVNEAGCEELLTAFEPFGQIEDIILLPCKSYSFVVFKKEDDAELAVKTLHGRKQKLMREPLYLSYAEKVPQRRNLFVNKDLPKGLIVIKDFITEKEEEQLLQCIKWEGVESQNLKHRKVKHFGFEFNYKTNNIDKNNPLLERIPEICLPLLEKLVERQYISKLPEQLTVNYYLPGQGIPAHVDTHSAFEDGIVSLSLESQIVMEFHHPDGHHIPVLLPRFSALIMTGESRYLWSHGITPRKMDIVPCQLDGSSYIKTVHRSPRTSFTFRVLCNKPCSCDYPEQCDSQNKEKRIDNIRKEEQAKQLESTHVLEVYNKIADHFSHTRHKEWPKVASFLDSLPCGSLLVDVGCGNGKYLGKHCNLIEIGCDFSESLIKICRKNGLEVFVADNLQLPLRSEIADACISIAVLHHLATQDRRINAIKELVRILKPKGKALIYVWALEQKFSEGISNYLKPLKDKIAVCNEVNSQHVLDECHLESAGIKLPVHINRTEFQHQDIFVPWHKTEKDNRGNKAPIYHRYYHVFMKGELEKLMENMSNVKIIESYYDQGNWCAIIQKL